ncbi:hypothetical protein GMORB2_1477 [Geosmithia morbida]|uniref:Uncharacterized protein n=1 Tax=Geosmithia morbida TaxID=1094350 RepID=A0A9P4Z032_9HYPO|nr:uncharacterized protein GMORB2_1477 [Geosmithia morbida]KAF4126231.1 hypothetical protein GMORB2_1477 [Geosmithia morbida]
MLRRSVIGNTDAAAPRRVSMPETTTIGGFWDHDSEQDCIRHVRDGRVERRERRCAMRDIITKVEARHRRATSQAKSEIAKLQAQLDERDREIYELNNATIIIDTERIWELESQVDSLRRDLEKAQKQQQQQQQQQPSWHNDIDEATWFNDTTDIIVSTPSRRARESFPTPPATSPVMLAIPETPSTGASRLRHVRALELESLQREMGRLAATLDEYKQMMDRLGRHMPQTEDLPDADASPTAAFEKQVVELVQSIGEKNALLTDMTTAVSSLGFAGADASEMLRTISLGFRQARLELEYLSPGECSLPLSHHGAKVLDLALAQLRDLARKVQEKEDAIDEYHAEELSLRRQLNDRVSFAERLKGDLDKATGLIGEKDSQIHQLEIGSDRLKGAVDSYLRDISELERLVEKMEAEALRTKNSASKDASVQTPSSEQQEQKQNALIMDLEQRVADATKSASELRDELDVVKSSRKKQLADVNKRNGQALALRDARIGELRSEIGRINTALSSAHWEIHRLRAESHAVREENSDLRTVLENVRAQLDQVKAMNRELAGAKKEGRGAEHGHEQQPKRLLSGKLARRSSRRRPDSGVGLIDEDEAEM